ncbi:MFS family permease [Friedmanniella endophytica]|uniref:MFS family permease n=1 Tax=Microlunatus kandeliicorticis TaxID=1759536 RepID=A0A7W3IQC6_9ACTN|nr:MFS transporter [Microlunatus kandeliicorticis]MBA8793309.1 MFS family permease [Microlunatus kandeliicorticis]
MSTTTSEPQVSLVPARLDRLPWSRFHWSVVVGLGVSWILDGLEIQIVSANGFAKSLGMNATEIGLTGTIYLLGQVAGALVFGRMTDRLGRKRLFILTLAIYLIGSAAAGLAPNMIIFWIFRFIAGAGIGGEYTAINSAIDELIPSKYRGRVDIAVNGTYWAGAALGAFGNLFFLNTDLFSENIGWRIAFFIGPVLGLSIIYLRRHIPESPRWLMTHGRHQEAENNVEEIERRVRESGHQLPEVDQSKAMSVKPTESIPFRTLAGIFLRRYPKRTIMGLTMMITQSFLYNAIFFSYATVLGTYYGVDSSHTSYYFFPFAIGNLLGPLVLGHLFDTVGRRKMILLTYGVAGAVLAVSAALFAADALSAVTQTVLWCICFFFASAGASSAYLTVSEIFPLELRGQAISYFFIVAQGFGALGPVTYGALVEGGRGPLSIGYVGASVIMIIGGVVAFACGVNAEGKALEDIADPLSRADQPTGGKAA